MESFDLLIVGTGPAGVQAALRARQAGKNVAVVERMSLIGGTCIHQGTIPSKTLRQAVIDLSGFREWGIYGEGARHRPRIPMHELRDRCDRVIASEVEWQERLLRSRGITIIRGSACFVDPNTLTIDGERKVRGDSIILAVGSRPTHPEGIPFDGRCILDSDEILRIDELPRSLTVVGGGVIGSEYAAIFSLLDIDVTLVNRTNHLLGFVDETIIEELERELVERGIRLELGVTVERIERTENGTRTVLDDGRTIETEALLFCAGRNGAAPDLCLDQIGLSVNRRGCLEVDENFRTAVPSVYAAGDVIGFPALASTSREQGRVAACHAIGESCRPVETLLPYGVYTVPEIAMVGPTEGEAKERGIDIAVGIGRYEDTARGQIIGDRTGVLKLLVDRPTRKLIAGHMIGTGAAELIHMAQMAIATDLEYTWFLRQVMNYPTLARVYKLAAWDLWEKLGD